MLHPLIEKISEMKDLDIENKISELQKKYFIASKIGNSDLCYQIVSILEEYNLEKTQRLLEKQKISLKNQEKNLDDLINID